MSYQNKPIRRSSLVSTWGVGAIVPFPHDESVMIAGLDQWQYGETGPFLINDVRLKRRLGVSELRWPPAYKTEGASPSNLKLKIPAVRFPTWHYCPFCGTMYKSTFYEKQPRCDHYQWTKGRVCSGKNHRKMIPERFVVVCENGHIDDFPVAEWVHSDGTHTYVEGECRIRRSTGGSSASLAGVSYECTCGAKKSMMNAMRPGALKSIGFHCRSCKPWLGIVSDPTDPCNAEGTKEKDKGLKVLLRGATNVWFSNTVSSILIPMDTGSEDSRINSIVEEFIREIPRTDGIISRQVSNAYAMVKKVDPEALYQAFLNADNAIKSEPDVSETMSEDDFRMGEYKILLKTVGKDDSSFRSINNPIDLYDPLIQKYFRSITLIPRLKETKAFAGFSRLSSGNADIKTMKSRLRLSDSEDWLPAIQVSGEGIFFEFNKDLIKIWKSNRAVIERIGILNKSYQKSYLGQRFTGDLNPEYVMIHTFAHLLINQLSYECGYGSSSISERIYCERIGDNHTMNGVLIYTSSGDSEGSLGGLVRQGKPGFVEETILNAVRNAEWCSSDPVCIQSHGQGPDSLNLAACHNCALLPETCCETGNRLLDRGVVVGTLDNRSMGFFSDIGY